MTARIPGLTLQTKILSSSEPSKTAVPSPVSSKWNKTQ